MDGAPSRGSPIRRPGDDELLLHAREAQPYAPVGAVHPERVRRQRVESPRERILVEPLDLPRLRRRLGVLGSDDDGTSTVGSEALEQPEAVRYAHAEPLSDRRSRRAGDRRRDRCGTGRSVTQHCVGAGQVPGAMVRRPASRAAAAWRSS